MSRRALFLSTALSVSLAGGLAGCVADGDATAYQLPVAQQVAWANRKAAESATMAQLNTIEPAAGRGTILLTRTEAVPTPEEQQSELRKLAEQVVAERQDKIIRQATEESQSYANTLTEQMASRVAEDLRAYASANVSATAAELKNYAYRVAGEAASQQATATEARLTATTTSELANLRVENAQLQQKLTQQSQAATNVTVQEVANLRAENARLQAEIADHTNLTATQVAQHTASEIERLRQENTQLAAQLKEQQQAVLAQAGTQVAALKETTDARLSAIQNITGAQIAATQQQNQTLMAALGQTTEAKLSAVKETTSAQTQATAAQVAALKETTDAKLSAVRNETFAQTQATASQVAALKEVTDAKLSATRDVAAAQAQVATSQVSALKESTNAKLDELKETTDAKLSAVRDVTDARIAASQQQNATLMAAFGSTTDAKLNAVKDTATAQTKATAAQVAALKETTDAKLSAVQGITGAQIAAVQQQNDTLLSRYAAQTDARMATLQSTTDAKLASLSDQQQVARQLAQLEIQRVNDALRKYTQQEFARQDMETKQSLSQVAEAARLDVLDLEAATDHRLEEIRNSAAAQAAVLSSRTAARLEAELAQAEEKQLKPEQVKQLAQNVVADATPQFRALALQTLAQSQDYIRTVAKDSIKDADPAVQEALAEAARQVITKDDKVVFAIREAVDQQLKQANLATAEDKNRTLLGPDHIPGDTTGPDIITADDITLDGKRLGVKAPAEGEEGVSTPARARQVADARPPTMGAARHRNDWVDLRSYKVVVHEDNRTLEQIFSKLLNEAEPFTGPWELKWKVSAENKDILNEKFSLDAETTFEEFINYIAQYMINDRGVKLTVNLFDAQRIMVITD